MRSDTVGMVQQVHGSEATMDAAQAQLTQAHQRVRGLMVENAQLHAKVQKLEVRGLTASSVRFLCPHKCTARAANAL